MIQELERQLAAMPVAPQEGPHYWIGYEHGFTNGERRGFHQAIESLKHMAPGGARWHLEIEETKGEG